MLNNWEPPKLFRDYQHIKVKRVAGAIGAEVSGVNIAEDLPDVVIDEITAALDENHVSFFATKIFRRGAKPRLRRALVR